MGHRAAKEGPRQEGLVVRKGNASLRAWLEGIHGRVVVRGVVVVQSNRAGSGRVPGRAKLLERGFVSADSLTPQKARVLLMVALTKTSDITELRRIFAEY